MKIEGNLIVNAPAEKVWKVVAHEFADIGVWASSIKQSAVNTSAMRLEGAPVAGRVCHVAGFNEIEESIIEYSDQDMTFTYEAKGLPFFVTSARNRWVITPIGAQSTRAQFFGELDLLPIIGLILSIPMRLQLRTAVNHTVEELKYYIETDSVHPRKTKSARVQPQQIQSK